MDWVQDPVIVQLNIKCLIPNPKAVISSINSIINISNSQYRSKRELSIEDLMVNKQIQKSEM